MKKRKATQLPLTLKTERKRHPGSVTERTPGRWYIRLRCGLRRLIRRAPATTRQGAEDYLDLVRAAFDAKGQLPRRWRGAEGHCAPSGTQPELPFSQA